ALSTSSLLLATVTVLTSGPPGSMDASVDTISSTPAVSAGGSSAAEAPGALATAPLSAIEPTTSTAASRLSSLDARGREPSRGEIAVIVQVGAAEGSARSTPPILSGERLGTLKARRVTAVPDHAQPLPDLALAQALAADLDAADFRSDPLRLLCGEEQDDALARGLREPIPRGAGG